MADSFVGNLLYNIVAEDKTEGATKSATERIGKIGMAAGAAMTAIGGAFSAIIASSKGLNAALGVTAMQIGVTQEELRNLALETTNVTFPLEEVQKTFDLLARSGITSTEEMQNIANAFDTLADATGYEASQITEIMIPAFNAFGVELQDAGSYTDMITHLMRNTTISMEDFSSTIDKLSPDIGTMGLTMEQTVAVLEALAEKGVQGSAATREFRTAVSAAKGDQTAFLAALGLTVDQLKPFQEELEGSTGMTKKFADAANQQYTILDKLKQSWSEITLKVGSALTPLEGVFGVMTALGPIMMGIGPIMSAFSAIQAGTVIPTLTAHATAAWAAIAPYLVIIAPIAAVIAILFILEKKFGLVTKIIEIATVAFRGIAEFIKSVLEKALEGLRKAVDFVADRITLFLGPIGLVIEVFKNWDKIVGIVREVLHKVLALLSAFTDKMKDAGKNIIQGLIDGIKLMINKPYDLIYTALQKIRRLLPFSPAKEGPLSKPVSWKSYLVDPLENLEPTLKSNLEKGLTVTASAPGGSGGVSANTATYNIGPNYLSKDYPFEALMKDIESYEQRKQIQRGVRAV
jgi:phage-related minor tail protein